MKVLHDWAACPFALAAGILLGAAVTNSALADDMMPGKGMSVTMARSSIAEEAFQTQIVGKGLEALGYELEDVLEIEYATMHVSLGTGDIDVTAVHWDPLHTEFYNNSGGDDALAKVGTLIAGSLQGYLIDKATADANNIDSFDDLADPEIAKLFDADGDGKADLTGCNPGWGCERVIEHQLDAYELRDTVNHNQGSYFAIMADTIARFENDEPILYYTWTPLWLSGVLRPDQDVVWLTVPFTSLPNERSEADTTLPDGRNLGFAINDQRVVANKEFLEANPAAAKFFELVEIPVGDVNAQNLLMNEGEDSPKDIARHVDEWIADNQADWDMWLEEARKAAM